MPTANGMTFTMMIAISRRDDRSMCEETASCIKIQEEKANDIAVIMVGLCWIGAI